MKKTQRKYKVNDNFFDNLNNEKLWLIGLIASDGNVANKFRFSISQSNKEGFKLLKYIKKLLKYNGKIYLYKKTNSYHLVISSQKIVKALSKFNIVPNKSLIYNLPDINKKYFKNYLRGYFDGDGCIYIKNLKQTKFIVACFVGTENFINNVNKILIFKGKTRKIKSAKNLYEISFNGKKAIEFLTWLYSDKIIYQSYKYKKFKSYLEQRNDKFTKFSKPRKLFNEGYSTAIIIKDCKNIKRKTIYQWRYRCKKQLKNLEKL